MERVRGAILKNKLTYTMYLVTCIGLMGLSACADVEDETSSTAGDAMEVLAGEESQEIAGEEESAGEESERGGLMLVDPSVEPPPPPYMHPEYAQQMLLLVNNFRAQGGNCGGEVLPSVPPLTLNRALNEASLDHAQDMAANDYFDHQSQDGRQPAERMQARGYRGSSYGENIAAGNASAEETFSQWRGSPGHCRNMLRSSFTELGVGYVKAPFSSLKHYWVQNFGRP